MPTVNLDTHVLIHALQGGLKPAEERLLREATWGISAIVFETSAAGAVTLNGTRGSQWPRPLIAVSAGSSGDWWPSP